MKSKAFSFINIFGLAIGLTCCMLITVYLRYEWNYDSYQKDAGNVYQLETEFNMQGKKFVLPATPTPMAAQTVRDFPEVRQATRLMPLSLLEDKDLLRQQRHLTPKRMCTSSTLGSTPTG